mgnify:CR=1 FL=1
MFTKKLTSGSRRFTDNSLFLSVIALVISVVISAIIMLLCGYNPAEAYSAIFAGAFGSLRGITQTLTQATPLIFTGLAFTLAKKANLINLGVEGQMYMGALGAALVGILDLGIPSMAHIMLAVTVGFLFGAAYGAIIGVLKVRFDANEVVAGVMLNEIATCFINFLLNGVLLAKDSIYNCTLYYTGGYYDGTVTLYGSELSVYNTNGTDQPVNACNVSGTTYNWLAIVEVGA